MVRWHCGDVIVQIMLHHGTSERKPILSFGQGCEGELWAVQAGVDSIEHGYYLDSEAIDMMLAR